MKKLIYISIIALFYACGETKEKGNVVLEEKTAITNTMSNSSYLTPCSIDCESSIGTIHSVNITFTTSSSTILKFVENSYLINIPQESDFNDNIADSIYIIIQTKNKGSLLNIVKSKIDSQSGCECDNSYLIFDIDYDSNNTRNSTFTDMISIPITKAELDLYDMVMIKVDGKKKKAGSIFISNHPKKK